MRAGCIPARPRIVELTAFEDESAVRVNIARLNSDFEGALPAFSVSLCCGGVKEAVRLPEGERIPFEYGGDETRLIARALDLFICTNCGGNRFRRAGGRLI